jgi:ABC-type antimicrobial peptide transport system permease subunit
MRAYTPITVWPEFLIKLESKQTLSAEMLVTMLQKVSSQIDLARLDALEDQRDKLFFTQYTTATTSVVLAVLTFLLATIGLYGIIKYSTQMRRFELGTRMAIGAKRLDIISLIIKDNVGAIGIGIVISLIILLVLSIGFSEALASYINVQLITLFFVTLVLICIMALFSCYWPLRSVINYPVIRSLRGNE